MASWPETKPLSEANLSDLVDRIIQAEQNIDAGKSAIVNAIVDMNQNANVTMTHSQLAALIRAISTDANAALNDVLNGRTFYQGGQRRTGTLSLTGNAADDDVLNGRTFYRNDAKTKRTGTLSLTGNATASQVLVGREFYSTNPKNKQIGTMPNRSGHVTAQSRSRSGTTLRLRPPEGYFNGNSNNSVQLNDPNWVAQNIRLGVPLFGLTGNLRPWNGEKRYAEGQGTTSGSSGSLTVTGLGFTPSIVLAHTTGSSTSRWVTYWAGRASSGFVYSSSFPYTSGSITHYEDPDPISVSGSSFTASIRSSGQDVLWIAVE